MDAVITWVDGRDPEHSKKLQKYMDRDQPHLLAAEPTRYRESGEIYFCLASIIKFAPFIQRIFIVTDEQTPARLDEFIEKWSLPQGFIKVVDHKEIFRGYEEHLPTFNSLTIETMLYRIPNLSDEFVYFNDDVLLTKPALPELFFDENGPVFRGGMKKYYKDRPIIALRTMIRKMLGTNQNKPGFRTAQQASGLIVGGLSKYLQVGHTPHPMRRPVLENHFSDKHEQLSEQLSHRFRHHSQFLTSSLANHLEIRWNSVEPHKSIHALYMNAAGKNISFVNDKFAKAQEQAVSWGCIQSLDEADQEIRTAILQKLREIVHDFPPE